jgi:hypothetical protein
MKEQTSITVSGALGDCIRALVGEFPGTTINRMGRAVVRLGLRRAILERAALVAELRQIDMPWDLSSSTHGGECGGSHVPDSAAFRCTKEAP